MKFYAHGIDGEATEKARKDLLKKIGKKVVSKENYLETPEKFKRLGTDS